MKKVLIVTYYWPPAGGIGVLRCLKFAKYLRQFGWEPIVFTAENAQYPYFDESNLKDIPENMEVLKCPIWEPFALFRKLSGRKKDAPLNNVVHVRDKKSGMIDNLAIWIRGNYFVPDARSMWIKPSVKYLSEYLKSNKVDAILSDGPPHTNTAIACEISKKFNIPWLADFQDPWTQVDYYPLLKIAPKADRKHKRMEQDALKTAKKTTIASPSWKKELEQIGGHNVDVIYYGYDEDDLGHLKPQGEQKFSIAHAGLLGHDRTPDGLFEALKELCEEDQEFQKALTIDLAGQVDYSVIELARACGLEGNLNLVGTVGRPDALQLLINSYIQLLPLNKADNVMGRMPGKLYEYLRAQREILSLGPNGTDVANVLEETKCGHNYEYSDNTGLKQYIAELWAKFKSGDPGRLNTNVSFYSNENQTRIVAGYLDSIVG